MHPAAASANLVSICVVLMSTQVQHLYSAKIKKSKARIAFIIHIYLVNLCLKDCFNRALKMSEAIDVPVNSLKVHFKEEDGTVFFESYVPPSRDAVHLPTYVLYLLMAVFIVLSVLYAIIGHLIKDLIHDFADWLFGAQPEEVEVNYCEAKDKFMADWYPETSPELEEMARAEEKNSIDKDFLRAPAIWIISDVVEARSSRSCPRVVFGKRA